MNDDFVMNSKKKRKGMENTRKENENNRRF